MINFTIYILLQLKLHLYQYSTPIEGKSFSQEIPELFLKYIFIYLVIKGTSKNVEKQ